MYSRWIYKVTHHWISGMQCLNISLNMSICIHQYIPTPNPICLLLTSLLLWEVLYIFFFSLWLSILLLIGFCMYHFLALSFITTSSQLNASFYHKVTHHCPMPQPLKRLISNWMPVMHLDPTSERDHFVTISLND